MVELYLPAVLDLFRQELNFSNLANWDGAGWRDVEYSFAQASHFPLPLENAVRLNLTLKETGIFGPRQFSLFFYGRPLQLLFLELPRIPKLILLRYRFETLRSVRVERRRLDREYILGDRVGDGYACAQPDLLGALGCLCHGSTRLNLLLDHLCGRCCYMLGLGCGRLYGCDDCCCCCCL